MVNSEYKNERIKLLFWSMYYLFVHTSDSFLQDKISSPTSWVESLPAAATVPSVNHGETCATHKAELTLLDLYSGCGGMSTGLHLGAKVSGVNILMVPMLKTLVLCCNVFVRLSNICSTICLEMGT